MSAPFWATIEKAGVYVSRGDAWLYIDSGDEFEAAVEAGPLLPRDIPFIPDPRQSAQSQARAELAAALGLTDAQLSAIIAAAT